MNTIKLLLLLAALCACCICWADPKIEIGVNFNAGFPENEFRQNVTHTGLGETTHFYYRISHSPFSLGGSLGFLIYGSQTRDALLSGPGVPEVIVPVKITNNILMIDFRLRYQRPPSVHIFRPYAEGILGFNYLFTQTSFGGGIHPITSTDFSDTALSLGGGGGVSIRLSQRGLRRLRPGYSIDLNLGAVYLFGGKADYLKQGSIRTQGDTAVYLVNHSRTNLLVSSVGITFAF